MKYYHSLIILAVLSTFANFSNLNDITNIFQELTPDQFPLANIAALLVTDITICFALLLLGPKINADNHKIKDVFNELKKGKPFGNILFDVTLEELLARGIFLGLGTTLFGHQPITIAILFLIGNLIFAFIHIANFQTIDQQLWKTYPQFITGIFFSYVYLKYGLIFTIFTHLAHNMILMANHKIEKFDPNQIYFLGYWTAINIIIINNFNFPLTDLYQWLNANNDFQPIPNWQFIDYLKASLFITSFSSFINTANFFDIKTINTIKENNNVQLKTIIFTSLVVTVIAYFTIQTLYFIINKADNNNLNASLATALVLISFITAFSGSGWARLFFVSLPHAFFTVCLCKTLPFQQYLVIEMVAVIISLPVILYDLSPNLTINNVEIAK